MVRGLVEAAPKIIGMMERLGVPFHRENGKLIERNFGGQKKKRTAYAMSSTGKVLTQALIDAVRK
jgi:succinate dehydrogenase / fumarate reductase flavoprotein subunit